MYIPKGKTKIAEDRKMTRFEKELSGALGEFWKKEAEKELQKIKAELEEGKITIDENGVARNCIGRVLMSDMAEKVSKVTDKISIEATAAERSIEVSKSIEEYKRNYKGPSAEELSEMRAAFGEGTKVVNILTGETINL